MDGRVDIVQELIRAGAALDVHDKDQWTALHAAAMQGSVDIVQELIRAGAALDVQDKDQLTALHSAAMQGNVDIVQELIRAGDALEVQVGMARLPGGMPRREATPMSSLSWRRLRRRRRTVAAAAAVTCRLTINMFSKERRVLFTSGHHPCTASSNYK